MNGATPPTVVLSIFRNDGQTGDPGTILAKPFAVRVTDLNGNGIGGAPITWTVLTGGGSIVSAVAQTGSEGYARAWFRLGPNPGQQTVQASTPGATPVVFTATAN
jgi:hypothetical protein